MVTNSNWHNWPKGPYTWAEGTTIFVSVPFTWNLPAIKLFFRQSSLLADSFVVGGPAVDLLPEYLTGMENVTVARDYPGVLQRVNPFAIRTTIGCIRHCSFCGVGTGKIEIGGIQELSDWPDGPLICDNNLLAASNGHIEQVLSRLIDLGGADFNQGLDARLLRREHAEMIATIKQPIIRLALDHTRFKDAWFSAYEILRSAGIPKYRIRSYCLIGFDDDPGEARERCEWVEIFGVRALPMWFHELDAMEPNTVTDKQKSLGWNDFERRKIMQWFYQHKKAVK